MNKWISGTRQAPLGADVEIAIIGPRESRRIRRERSESSAATAPGGVANPSRIVALTPEWRSGIVFSDEAGGAVRDNTMPAAGSAAMPSLTQILPS